MIQGQTPLSIAINITWLILWIAIAFLSLFMHNSVLPYMYIAFLIIAGLGCMYCSCTYCCYFGKNCYILCGRLASMVFKAKNPKENLEKNEFISSLLILGLALFPMLFLLYYRDWFFLGIYLVTSLGWFIWRKQQVCKSCENQFCALYPK